MRLLNCIERFHKTISCGNRVWEEFLNQKSRSKPNFMPGLHIGWNSPNPSCVCMYIRMCKCKKKIVFSYDDYSPNHC